MMEIIKDEVERRKVIDQWYKQPSRYKRPTNEPQILMDEDGQVDKWKHIAQ